MQNQPLFITIIFQIESHLIVKSPGVIVRCYGITKDPETQGFMMVMAYAQNGSLRQHLNNSFNSLSWNDKLNDLLDIALGIKNIHEKGLIHRDFHCGNILNNDDNGKVY